MAKLGVLTLTGASNTKYKFSVYPSGADLEALGGVYHISKRTLKQDGGGSHARIYIGQTADLSTCFDSHHKQSCFDHHNSICVGAHIDDKETSRVAKEEDLIKGLRPPCNG